MEGTPQATVDDVAAPAGPVRAVVLRGQLTDIPLVDALRLVASSSKTGVLRLHGSFEGSVYFRSGKIVFADADRVQPLDEALGGGQSSDAVSVDWERAPDELEETMRQHVVDVVFELMVLSEGSFEFVTGVDDPWLSPFPFGLPSILTAVDRRVAEWKEVAESIPPMHARLRMAPQLPTAVREITVTSDEWQVVALLARWVTVSDAVANSALRPFDACRAIQGLVRKGLVSVRSEG